NQRRGTRVQGGRGGGVVHLVAGGDAAHGQRLGGDVGGGRRLSQRVVARVSSGDRQASHGHGLAYRDRLAGERAGRACRAQGHRVAGDYANQRCGTRVQGGGGIAVVHLVAGGDEIGSASCRD